MLFAFGLNAKLWLALARGDAEPLIEALSTLPNIPAMAQWATFLRNHDELDLSRLTDDQRGDVMAAFAPQSRHAALRPWNPPPPRPDDEGRPHARPSWRTHCSSRCPGPPSSGTARRSVWART